VPLPMRNGTTVVADFRQKADIYAAEWRTPRGSRCSRASSTRTESVEAEGTVRFGTFLENTGARGTWSPVVAAGAGTRDGGEVGRVVFPFTSKR
jgi:hypothetical protein